MYICHSLLKLSDWLRAQSRNCDDDATTSEHKFYSYKINPLCNKHRLPSF